MAWMADLEQGMSMHTHFFPAHCISRNQLGKKSFKARYDSG
jgi:hypothetical protein